MSFPFDELEVVFKSKHVSGLTEIGIGYNRKIHEVAIGTGERYRKLLNEIENNPEKIEELLEKISNENIRLFSDHTSCVCDCENQPTMTDRGIPLCDYHWILQCNTINNIISKNIKKMKWPEDKIKYDKENIYSIIF